MRAFLYILSASPNPDWSECAVPWMVDRDTIFFGPCKKRLRRLLKKEILLTQKEARPQEGIYVIGFNGANNDKVRKIVWAGRITRVMTFEQAFHSLTGPRYEPMREDKLSPLHLKPVTVDSRFGYQLVSEEHAEGNAWVRDVVDHSRQNRIDVNTQELQVLLKPDFKRHEVFIRDCCFLCENIFYARGEGIGIAGDILEILQEAQPDRPDVDDYGIFGYRKDRTADGRTGRYLEKCDPLLVKRLIEAITQEASILEPKQLSINDTPPIVCLRGCNDE